MNKSILVISYYSNMPGACQAEWVDDRINSFLEKGYKISVITSICCFKHTSKLNHYRIQSILPKSFIYEYEEIQRRSIPYSKKKLKKFSRYYSFSKFLNRIFSLFGGEGRWDWFITTFIWSLFNYKKIKSHSVIYSTGGPPSAHLLGVFYKILFNKNLLVEFQDPLTGEDIGRNKVSKYGLSIAEKFIIKKSDLVAYCTEMATKRAKKVYQSFSEKIYNIYPGSSLKSCSINTKTPKKINITYLGSLYQTRNLDNFMKALYNLNDHLGNLEEKITVNIYGNIDKDIRERILAFKLNIIKYHGLIPRHEVSNVANKADVLLLIQNTDKRSSVTIPFKLYDYLAMKKLTLGLTYCNEEINNLLSSHGHLYCDANDVRDIQDKIFLLLDNYSTLTTSLIDSTLTPMNAADNMISLYNKLQ